MFTFVFVCRCVRVRQCVSVRLSVSERLSVCVCAFVRLCVLECVFLYEYMWNQFVFVYLREGVCVYVCVNVCCVSVCLLFAVV